MGWPGDFWTINRTPSYHASSHIMNHNHIHGLNNPGWKDPPKWSVDPRKPELLQGLQEADLSTASPIQQQSLLAIFAGKSLLAKAGFERLLNLARTSCSAPFLLPLFMCHLIYTRLCPFNCGDPVVGIEVAFFAGHKWQWSDGSFHHCVAREMPCDEEDDTRILSSSQFTEV